MIINYDVIDPSTERRVGSAEVNCPFTLQQPIVTFDGMITLETMFGMQVEAVYGFGKDIIIRSCAGKEELCKLRKPKRDGCFSCGAATIFVRTALVCPQCGPVGGI